MSPLTNPPVDEQEDAKALQQEDTLQQTVKLSEGEDLQTSWVFLQAIGELVETMKGDIETAMRSIELGDEPPKMLLSTGVKTLHYWVDKFELPEPGENAEPDEGECCQGGSRNVECDGCPNG